jgi:transposase InsO family protein
VLRRPIESAQYLSGAFAAVCDRHRMRRSTGRTGSSSDNALAEAFFATSNANSM